MAEQFSMSAAAGFAYRKRESGRLLVQASAAYVAGMLIVLSVWASANREAFTAYLDLVRISATGARPDQARMAEVAEKLAPSYLLLIPVVGLLYSAFEAAVQRWLVRNITEGRTLGLHFGADTLRLLANFGLWLLFVFIASTGVLLVAGLAGALGGGERNPVLTGLFGLVGMIAGGCVWAYLAVRLAPAAAITIGREKLSFLEAWTATRGRFWPLLGAFAVILVIYLTALLIADMVAGSLFLGPVFANSGSGAASLFDPAIMLRFGAFYALVLSVAQVFVVGMMGVNAFAALVAHDEGKV